MKSKVSFILILSCLFTCLFTTFAFASDDSNTDYKYSQLQEKMQKFNKDFKYYVIYNSADQIHAICSNQPLVAAKEDGKEQILFYASKGDECKYTSTNLVNGEWEDLESYTTPGDFAIDRYSVCKKILASSYDVKYKDSNDVFFYKPQTIVLAHQTLKVQGILKEVVSLLPLLIGCLVSWIALRKGLAFLRSVLLTA